MSRFLNEAIDKALTDPPKQLLDDLQPLVRLQETEALADRVRRRATALVRSDRAHADTIMSTRDQIILTLYHAASLRLAHSVAIRALPRSAEVGWASRRDHT